MALEEQMSMDLGDVPDNTVGIDPVSGNEIPLGSTAEEVRDDIPANLSENEMVIPADVVKYWGVKLFEDLRAEAKMGYAQMQEDGRIGGEPMEEDIDIEISMEDVEMIDSPDAAEPEDAFLGKFFAGIREANKKQVEENNKTRDRSYKAIKARAKANKNKPKNRAEALLEAIRNRRKGEDNNRRPKLEKKPATSDTKSGPSIAEQINFGGDYRDKKKTTKKPAQTKGAGEVSKAYTGKDDKQDVRYYDKGFVERFVEGLGFDEGGLAEEPFYSQKGGFDVDAATGNTGVQVIEYMNDEGHRIFITFIDGVAQSEIPEGYYPVGDPIDINTVVNTGDLETAIGGSTGGSDMGDSGSGTGANMPTPEPINYKELTFDELKGMVDDMSSFGTKLSGLSIITKSLMKLSQKSTVEEIKRRRDDPYTSEVDKRRYDELLEMASREQPGLVETIFNKITGKEPEKPAVRTQEQTDALYAQLDKMTKAYTPDTQTSNDKTTPGVDKTASQIIQDSIDIKRIEDEMNSQPRPSSFSGSTYDEVPEARVQPEDSGPPTVATPTVRGNTRLEQDAQRRRDRQEANKNITGSTARKTGLARSATRGLGTTDKKGGAALDSRFGISGLDKGGIARKKNKKKKSK